MLIRFERVDKASRLRKLDEAFARPEMAELTKEQQEAVRGARDHLAAIPGEQIEYVHHEPSKGDAVVVPEEVQSTVRRELERRIAMVDALGDPARQRAYSNVLFGFFFGAFGMGGECQILPSMIHRWGGLTGFASLPLGDAPSVRGCDRIRATDGRR